MLRYQKTIFILLILLGFALRMTIISHGLPFISHIDEPNFYILSGIQRGALTQNWRTIWLEGYPPGYIWFYAQINNALDMLHPLNPHTEMSIYIGAMRIISALADTLTLALVIALARMLGGAVAALLSGITYTIAAEIIYHSGLAITDAIMTLLVVFCVVLTLIAWRKHQTIFALIAIVYGLAAITFKYSVFLVLLAPAIFFLRLLWQKRARALLPATLALVLVFGTAYWLLFVYGATHLHNAEAEFARSAPLLSLFSLSQWRLTLIGLTRMLNLPMLVIAGTGFLLAIIQRPYRDSILVWITTIGILATVPVFIVVKSSPERYLWFAAALLIPLGFSAWSRVQWVQRHRLVFVLMAGIILLWGLPETWNTIREIRRPFTYTQLQLWAAENLDADAVIYVESNVILRTIARYEAGFPGYQDFQVDYADDYPHWQVVGDEVDYIFTHGIRKAYWDTQAVSLMIAFGDPAMQGIPLYVYVNEAMPAEPIARFTQGDTAIILRDLDVTRENQMLKIDTYWQASSSPTQDYSYSLYITPVDDTTQVLAQQDAGLGVRPSSTWIESELIAGNIAAFTLPDTPPPGEYTIWLAVYYWETLERLVLPDGATALRVMDVTIASG